MGSPPARSTNFKKFIGKTMHTWQFWNTTDDTYGIIPPRRLPIPPPNIPKSNSRSNHPSIKALHPSSRQSISLLSFEESLKKCSPPLSRLPCPWQSVLLLPLSLPYHSSRESEHRPPLNLPNPAESTVAACAPSPCSRSVRWLSPLPARSEGVSIATSPPAWEM